MFHDTVGIGIAQTLRRSFRIAKLGGKRGPLTEHRRRQREASRDGVEEDDVAGEEDCRDVVAAAGKGKEKER
jgi:hypothetical protein